MWHGFAVSPNNNKGVLMKNGKTAVPEFKSETQDTLRKAKVDQLRQDINAGLESGTATLWNAEEIKRAVRKKRVNNQG